MLVLVRCIFMTHAAPLSHAHALEEGQHKLHYVSGWDAAAATAPPNHTNGTASSAHVSPTASSPDFGLSTAAMTVSETFTSLSIDYHQAFSGLDEDATWSVETGLPTAIGPVVLDKSHNGHVQQIEQQEEEEVGQGTTGINKGLVAGLITGAIVLGLGMLLGLLYFCKHRKTLVPGSASTYSSSSFGSIEKSSHLGRTESMSSEDRALATHINTRLNETDEYMSHIGGMALVRSINSRTRDTPSLKSDSSDTTDNGRPWVPARRKIASAENDVSQADHGTPGGSWITAHTPTVVHEDLSDASDSVSTMSSDQLSLPARPENPTALRLINPDESMSEADDLSVAAANGRPARLYSHENLGISTSRYSTGSQGSSAWSSDSVNDFDRCVLLPPLVLLSTL